MSDAAVPAAIADIERRIEGLQDRIERCRKAMLISRVAIWGGGATLLAVIFLGELGRSAVAVLLALSAIIGGFTWLGANKSTREEAERDLAAAEMARTEMIERLSLQDVPAPTVVPFLGAAGTPRMH